MNFIEVNGVSLRYDVQGSGKPLVLIHEMGGTMESWDLVVPALAAKRRVIRYDTRGAGFSEKIRGVLKIATMTNDLIALLDALGIKEKVALAGTAVGGAIALHTAVRFPRARRRRDRLEPRSLDSRGEPRRRAGARRALRARRPALRGRRHRRQRLPGGAAYRPGEVRGLPRALARQRPGELRQHLPHARRHGPDAASSPRSDARCW